MDVFVLAYVGLSTDPDGNGYCEIDVFDSHDKAVAKMGQCLINELEEQKDYQPRVEHTGEDEVSIWWCGDNEGVKMKIFRKHVN